MAVVTALRPDHDRVAVELDGAAWRTLPVEAVVEVGLGAGVDLDRYRARELARVLRRLRAERVAVQEVARRDHTRVSLDRRLARGGITGSLRGEVLERAERSGLVDDERFAGRRAALLAERGAGDLLVLSDLERHGVEEPVARAAVAELAPEAERAARVVDRRGRSVRTLRYLASRGFSEETLEPLIAEIGGGELR